MPAYLDSILDAHRAAAAADGRDPGRRSTRRGATWPISAPAARRGPRRFAAALEAGRAARGMAVISEIKRRSPSKGDLDPTLDPAAVAVDYEAGGAVVPVGPDRRGSSSGASRSDLEAARAACSLPVLRKDFTVGALDVCDARLMGADAVLLIVAALDDAELVDLLGLARALRPRPRWSRSTTRTSSTGPWPPGPTWSASTSATCAPSRSTANGRCGWGSGCPTEVVAVAESGIRDAADVERLAAAGYTAVLVGETLVRSADRSVGGRRPARRPA